LKAENNPKSKTMANTKEAKARIKINKLLEQAGWRFFDNEKGKANISLEPNVKLTQKDIGAFGSALPWHGRGDGFESRKVHHQTQISPPFPKGILALLNSYRSVNI
jgi:hypothetical protein